MLKQATDTVMPLLSSAEAKPSINQAILIEKQSNQWKFSLKEVEISFMDTRNPIEKKKDKDRGGRGREPARNEKTINQQ